MAEAVDPLLLHLHKIPSSTSEETLDRVLHILWETRKTGLGSVHKPDIRTLLALPTPQHLDLVLACLRLIIRKCLNEKLTGEDIEKLLPVDLSIDFRSILVNLLQKHRNQWKEEASRDQPLWQQTRVSHQIKVNAPHTLVSFPTSELLTSLWPRQDDVTSFPNSSNHGAPVAVLADPRLTSMARVPFHQDDGSSENMAIIPRLKSLTWMMENQGLTPANRVAVITLKLHDYTKSPSGEIEVKFQVSKDTLDAMIRSMAYISEQLSNTVVSHSEPSLKKQRQ